MQVAAFTSWTCLACAQSNLWFEGGPQVLWSEERHKLTTAEGEPYSVVSGIQRSFCLIRKNCLIVKTKDLLKKAETTMFGLTRKVRAEVIA